MMSLEEIIKALTKCDGNCGGGCEFSSAYGCNVMFVLKGDILHHLKDYRQTIKYLEVQHDHVEQLCEYFKNNPPLTWNELKDMEGKPIWVEQHHGDTKGWLLILRKCDDVVTCTTKHGNSFYLYKANYGEKWKAYRREK